MRISSYLSYQWSKGLPSLCALELWWEGLWEDAKDPLPLFLVARSDCACSQDFPFSSFMGGNSTKATSGINGAGTQTQQELGIPDSAKIFFEDTKRSVSPSQTTSSPRDVAY